MHPQASYSRARLVIAILLPPVLIATMLWLYPALELWFGHPLGYLIGFAIYWFGWCLGAPAWLLGGPTELLRLFRPWPSLRELSWKDHLLLWPPIAFPLLFRFAPFVGEASANVVLASVALAVLVGVTEEVLWRGLYARLFPHNLLGSVLYPSLMFGLWHVCPLSVLPNRNPGGIASFVIYAGVLGVLYALAVRRTGSIAWVTVAHVFHDSLGLGGTAYSSWLG